jgi:hypothetical protein
MDKDLNNNKNLQKRYTDGKQASEKMLNTYL